MKKNLSVFKHKMLKICQPIEKILRRSLKIFFIPIVYLHNYLVSWLPENKRHKIHHFENKVYKSRGARRAFVIAVVMLIIPLILYQLRPPSYLPYSEKVTDGAWILRNRDPQSHVFANNPTKGPDLKENKSGEYKWSVNLKSGTVFSFGKQEQDGVSPSVKIVSRDGYFVEYLPKGFNGFVNPKVNGNKIEWEIYPGVTARYEMLSDRVKADYVVSKRENIQAGKLEFDFTSGNDKNPDQILTGELFPDGEIAWSTEIGQQMETKFTIPKPVTKDTKSKNIGSKYLLTQGQKGNYLLSIVLSEKELSNSSFPITVDPVVIDSAASATGTAYGNSRKIIRDTWGNLITLFDGGTGDDNVYYKNYNSSTWTDAAINLDGGAGNSNGIAADIDSRSNIHVVLVNSTDSDLEYSKLTVTRGGSNTISSIAQGTVENIDTSDVTSRPSIVVANKGAGLGKEKVVISYNVNGTNRGEIRTLTRDVVNGETYFNTVDSTSGLVGYWRLNEPSGTNANDESATNNDGTYTNTPTLSATGGLASDSDTATSFNASQSEYVTIPDNDAYSVTTTGELTVEAWALGTSLEGGVIVSKGASSNYEWQITQYQWLGGGGNGIYYQGNHNTSGGSGVADAGNETPAEETWHHVVMTLNDNTDTMIVYIDGVEAGRDTTWVANPSNGTAALNIGRRADNCCYFNSTIDEVAIYNRALTDDEIESHWDLGSTWKNASEEKYSQGTISDTEKNGGVGLPSSATLKGTADASLVVSSTTTHHNTLNQLPGKPRRSPDSVMKDANGTYSSLTQTNDNSSTTANNVGGLTTTDYLYIGDDKPFSKATIDFNEVNNANTSTLSTAQYWDGTTWTSLSNFTDNTYNGTYTFFNDGSLLFDQPTTWTTTTVNGVSGKYWIRVRPSAALPSTVNIKEIYVNDRNSNSLIISGGVDSTDDLGISYVPWDDITDSRWENNMASVGASFRNGITAIDTLGGNWTGYTNFPLSSTVDYSNSRFFLSYVEDTGTDVLHVKNVANNKDPSVAANWTDTGFPTVTEASDLALNLSSDESDVYLLYVLDPGTNNLVLRRCSGIAVSSNGVCDNTNDWGSEVNIYNDTTVSHPSAVATKVTSDVVGIDFLLTDTTDSDVLYERHFADLTDKKISVAASADDAEHSDCTNASEDDQVLIGTFNALGLISGGGGVCASGDVDYNLGLRFPSVSVAPGAKISSAYVDLRVTERTGSAPISFTIYAEDVDSAASFNAYTNNCPSAGLSTSCIGDRTRTTNSASYSINFDGSGSTGTSYRLDVTDLIQEVICRGVTNSQPCIGDYNGSGTWASGNNIALLLVSNVDSGSTNYVQFVTYDDSNAVMLDPTLQINCEGSCSTSAATSNPPSSVWCNVGSTANGASDCNGNWKSRKKVTFDNRASAENLTNFPVLVRLDSNTIDYGEVQNAAQDLRFIDSDGLTLLDYEIEKWDEAGESIVWVEVPSITLGVATDYVWMYYNNSQASAGANDQGTWNTNYEGVWHLKENPTSTCSGANEACDSTSNNADGDMLGSMTSADSINGLTGNAIDFDGSDDSFTGSDAAFPSGNSARTVEGWIRTTFAGDSFARAILGYGTGVDPQDFDVYIANGALCMKIRVTGSCFTTTGIVNDGNWHHVAVSYDGTNFEGYIDGVEVGSDYNPGTNPNTVLAAFYIGLYSNWFSGMLDEVRISSNDQSADWIEANYLNLKPDSTYVSIGAEQAQVEQKDQLTPYSTEIIGTPGLVGYWRLGELSGTNANDSSITNNDGTYTNTPTFGGQGAIVGDTNTSTSFAAASLEYVTIPDHAAYDFGTGDFSLEVWVNRSAAPGAAQFILGHSGDNNADDWELFWRGGINGLSSRIDAVSCASGTSTDISDSAWHHVVVTMDRDGLCTWYIDGQVSGTPTDISSESATDLTNTSPLYIGRRNSGSYYDGPIDEVAVYKGVVLTSAQIQRHYTIGRGTPSVGAKNYSKGFTYTTGSGSYFDLDHPLSSAEYVSVEGNDNNYAVVSGDLNVNASTSATPTFMFKINNPNNLNTNSINATAVVKSSVATSIKPVSLQIYRGGSTNNWVTLVSDSSSSPDTDLTLAYSLTTNLSEYYFNESPGIGTRYAACTNNTANCWAYLRVIQDAPSTSSNEVLSLDMFDAQFTNTSQPAVRGGTRLRGGSRLR